MRRRAWSPEVARKLRREMMHGWGSCAMTDDELPIVYKGNVLGAAVTLVFCFFAVWAGYARITDEGYHYSSSHFGPFEFSPAVTGWALIAIGLPFGFLALFAIVRRCPTLTLAESGIIIRRCLRDPVNVAWSEFADVTIRSISARGGIARIVYVVTKDGKDISPGPVRGKADDIEATIRRVAARMGAALRER
jgi:hypothetical protein